jgi:hypothetical protein
MYVDVITENIKRILFDYVKTMPLLGAPLQVFSALTTGAVSTVTDPEGAPIHVAKMAGNVSSGVLGSVSAITGAVASGINMIGDKERSRQIQREKKYVPFQHMIKGVIHGFGDVISKPSLANVVGIVTKPVAGTMQDISAATGAAAGALTSQRVSIYRRYRMPRVFGDNGSVMAMNNLVQCIQNERRLPTGWSTNMLPGDPPAWTDGAGKKKDKAELEEETRRDGYVLAEWRLEEGKAGEHAWWYAEDFDHVFHAQETPVDVVRRRFWYALKVTNNTESRRKPAATHVDPTLSATTFTPPSANKPASPISTVTVETYENQRDFKIFGFGKSLLPTDRAKWSNREGTKEQTKESFTLPSGWSWEGDWYVVAEPGSEGWEYAVDFTSNFHAKKSSFDCVRRRLWRRKMLKR